MLCPVACRVLVGQLTEGGASFSPGVPAETEEDHKEVAEALQLVKELVATVDSKVNEHEKKQRLKEVHGRMDSKSIMRMKSGQMFAREDLLHGRKLLHDGPLQLKNSVGRLKGKAPYSPC